MNLDFSLRYALPTDSNILFEWRNDWVTRRMSRNSNKIDWAEHKQWLKSSLDNPYRQLFIAEENGISVGTIRTDFFDNSYRLSWTVSPEFRDRGVGTRMVMLLMNRIKEPLEAEIKLENFASIRIAEKCGMKLKYEKDGFLVYRRE